MTDLYPAKANQLKLEKINSKEIGEWKYYRENGKIGRTGYYKNGEKTGEWNLYDEDGKLQTTKQYD